MTIILIFRILALILAVLVWGIGYFVFLFVLVLGAIKCTSIGSDSSHAFLWAILSAVPFGLVGLLNLVAVWDSRKIKLGASATLLLILLLVVVYFVGIIVKRYQ